jgi:hypothetical protein
MDQLIKNRAQGAKVSHFGSRILLRRGQRIGENDDGSRKLALVVNQDIGWLEVAMSADQARLPDFKEPLDNALEQVMNAPVI